MSGVQSSGALNKKGERMYLVYKLESSVYYSRSYGPPGAASSLIPIAFFTTREKLDRFLKEAKKHNTDHFEYLRIDPAIKDRKEITSTMKRKLGWRNNLNR